MKSIWLALAFLCAVAGMKAGTIEKRYYYGGMTAVENGGYSRLNLPGCSPAGAPGEPSLPWQMVALLLPPGEAAVSAEVILENEIPVPGRFTVFPAQPPRPLSEPGKTGLLRSEQVYTRSTPYPSVTEGRLMTQFLEGRSVAIYCFTPVRYLPATGSVSYYGTVTLRITTAPDTRAQEAMRFLRNSDGSNHPIDRLIQNPEAKTTYPPASAPVINYDYLVVCPTIFKNEFQPIVDMYAGQGLSVRVVTTDSIASVMTGYDLQEKIRNFILNQRLNHGIDYVLLAGNPSRVPSRGFYCQVNSGGTFYTDSNIPADLYYSGLDGNYDANGNHIYGETDDSPDLLPEVSVGRFTVNDTSTLRKMIRKTVSYATNPVLGEFNRPLLAGEYLYDNPPTYGGDYMELLIDDHTDNGYFTHGIPDATNDIEKLYDTPSWSWSVANLLASINSGKSAIHHLGHANTTYMLRMSMSTITNANFAQVNGVIRNFQFLYTQGCYDGAFDAGGSGCIAAKAVSIDNFLVAGVFNSRYGWFNQGTTDGPSQHLEREFVSAMYTDTLPEHHLGPAHLISKIKTAPFVSLPGEFEPGAQRWCHYCCNVFGDPALRIRTEEPDQFSTATWTGAIDTDWNKAGNWSDGKVPTSLYDVVIPDAPFDPVITTVGATWCHNLTIQTGGNLIIAPGKTLTVYGTVTME